MYRKERFNMTYDQQEVTTEIMEEAQDSAIDILNALSSSNPIVDFIALQIAAKTYVASTPFPTAGLRRFDRKIHDHRDVPSHDWEEFMASSELGTAISQLASELGLTDFIR